MAADTRYVAGVGADRRHVVDVAGADEPPGAHSVGLRVRAVRGCRLGVERETEHRIVDRFARLEGDTHRAALARGHRQRGLAVRPRRSGR